jgi:hypothetical protein
LHIIVVVVVAKVQYECQLEEIVIEIVQEIFLKLLNVHLVLYEMKKDIINEIFYVLRVHRDNV